MEEVFGVGARQRGPPFGQGGTRQGGGGAPQVEEGRPARAQDRHHLDEGRVPHRRQQPGRADRLCALPGPVGRRGLRLLAAEGQEGRGGRAGERAQPAVGQGALPPHDLHHLDALDGEVGPERTARRLGLPLLVLQLPRYRLCLPVRGFLTGLCRARVTRGLGRTAQGGSEVPRPLDCLRDLLVAARLCRLRAVSAETGIWRHRAVRAEGHRCVPPGPVVLGSAGHVEAQRHRPVVDPRAARGGPGHSGGVPLRRVVPGQRPLCSARDLALLAVLCPRTCLRPPEA
mmetsp:Transcript_106781/g.284108  ORF Transcript_106781/g.284108 Transcript_106781/m.284108 type:complete len:286 (-) Transcript_106781:571-1428(-)